MERKFFLSHASTDKALVEHVLDFFGSAMDIRRSEIFCTSLKGTLPPGENFIPIIKENIKDCRVVIFLITQAYLESPFCLAELGAAWALNQKIYPLLVAPVTYQDLERTPLKGVQCLKLDSKEDMGVLYDYFIKNMFVQTDVSRFNKELTRFLMDISQETTNSPKLEDLAISQESKIDDEEGLEKYINRLQVEAEKSFQAQFLLGCIYVEGVLLSKDCKKGVHFLTRAAENNHPAAQFKLSSMYYKGLTGEQSFEKAFYWEKRAADENEYAPAMNGLAWLYRAGLGCKRNLKEAQRWYKKAIDKGYLNACRSLAEVFEMFLQSDDMIKWLEKSADLNDAYACYKLAKIYKDGLGENSPDYLRAAEFFRISADHGWVDAQYELGQMYYMGYGFLKRDFKESIKWFEMAAQAGHVDSQYNTAYQYQYGLGVEEDMAKAIMWYEKAANHGHILSQIDVADIYASKSPANYTNATMWYERACNQHSFEAYRKLGDIYYWGLGCKADRAKALRYYRLAAEQGDEIAKIKLSKQN